MISVIDLSVRHKGVVDLVRASLCLDVEVGLLPVVALEDLGGPAERETL